MSGWSKIVDGIFSLTPTSRVSASAGAQTTTARSSTGLGITLSPDIEEQITRIEEQG